MISPPLFLILPHTINAKDAVIGHSHAVYQLENTQVIDAPTLIRTIDSEIVAMNIQIRIMLQHPRIYRENQRVDDFFSVLAALTREEWLDCYVAFESITQDDQWQDMPYIKIERYQLHNYSRATRRLDLWLM